MLAGIWLIFIFFCLYTSNSGIWQIFFLVAFYKFVQNGKFFDFFFIRATNFFLFCVYKDLYCRNESHVV